MHPKPLDGVAPFTASGCAAAATPKRKLVRNREPRALKKPAGVRSAGRARMSSQPDWSKDSVKIRLTSRSSGVRHLPGDTDAPKLDTPCLTQIGYSKEANMTDNQVNRIVEHLCQHLHVAIRLKGTQPAVRPPNLKDLGLDPASAKTVLLAGLHWAGVTVADHTSTETEPPWS
jgi:hypothetical protein